MGTQWARLVERTYRKWPITANRCFWCKWRSFTISRIPMFRSTIPSTCFISFSSLELPWFLTMMALLEHLNLSHALLSYLRFCSRCSCWVSGTRWSNIYRSKESQDMPIFWIGTQASRSVSLLKNLRIQSRLSAFPNTYPCITRLIRQRSRTL